METPLIAGFIEKQHEAKTWTWSGKKTEGQASPSDCHNKAKIIFNEDFLWAAYHRCFIKLRDLVYNFSSGSIFIFNSNVDGAM
jgi:hypothetical protein